MAVRIKGTFRKDTKEYDGLGAISEEIVANPLQRVTVIAELEVDKFETDVKGGGIRTPKMEYVSMEVMRGDDLVVARKLRDAAYHERTGQTAPPPTLFDEGLPGSDAHDGQAQPWPGDEGYVEPAEGERPDDADPGTPDELATKRGRKR